MYIQKKSQRPARKPIKAEEELEATIQKNGITILKDNYVVYAEDLVILGREDISVETRLKVEEAIIFIVSFNSSYQFFFPRFL